MKKIIYKFNDGSTKTVEVTDEFYSLYMEMEKENKNSDRREVRRHVSFDYLSENGIEIADKQSDDDENEEVRQAILQLSPEQQDLIKKIFYEGLTASEIAKAEGVDKSAISKRLARIYEKLKKVCKRPSTFDLSRGYKCRHNKPNTYKEEQ